MTLNKDGNPRKVSSVRGNDPAMIHAAVTAYASGQGLVRIGSALGMTAVGVRRILIRAGVTMRRAGGARAQHYSQHTSQMRSLRAAGWSFRAIGDKYGISKQAVQQLLTRNNA